MKLQVILSVLYYVGSFLVMAEALNKLERIRKYLPTVNAKERSKVALSVVAWFLTAIGSAGAMATLVLPIPHSDLQDTAMIVGFALLLISKRVREEFS